MTSPEPTELGVWELPAGSSWSPTYRLRLNGQVIDPSEARYTVRQQLGREQNTAGVKDSTVPGDVAFVSEGNDTLVRFLWSRDDLEAVRTATGPGLYQYVIQVVDSTAPGANDAFAYGWLELVVAQGTGILPA